MNIEQARLNMIEQQIRPWEVLDQGVLDLVASVHREDFVPRTFRDLAFADTNIPLGRGEVMMAPKVEARMLQALTVHPDDRVLEIGTGSGYVTALLSRSARHVVSVDIHADFVADAELKLRKAGASRNVALYTGNAVNGWEAAAPYDVIAVTGSVPLLQEHFQRQLAVGGRLFVIVGEAPVMEALLITRVDDNEWATESLFETDLPALVGAPRPERFVL